jgi:hypothetical protein
VLAAVLAALGVAGVALGVSVVVDAYSPVPFADFWSQFSFLEPALDGDIRLADLWAQVNEHRILVARLQFLVDYALFDGTFVFLFAAIVVSSLLLAATYAAIAWRETRDGVITLGVSSAASIAALSPVADENLTWSYQVQFVQVFLFATAAVAALAVAARASGGRTWLWTGGSVLAAAAATYSMANGLLVWPVLVVLALALRLPRAVVLAVGLAGAALTASYLWQLEFTTRSSLDDPVRLLGYAAAYLGSALQETSTAVAISAGTAGLALLGVLCAQVWRRRTDPGVALPFGAGVGCFVLLTALQTAAGRLSLFEVSQALSPRYALGSFTFWLALLVGYLPALRERLGRYAGLALPAVLAAAAALLLTISVTARPDPDELQETVFGKETTVLAHVVGVEDASGTLTGGPSGRLVDDVLDWMAANRLGPWAPGGNAEDMRLSVTGGNDAPECAGSVESADPVGGGLRLRGWIVPPADEDARNIAVRAADGTDVGQGRVGSYRRDILEAGLTRRSRTGFVAYARGEPSRPLTLLLVGHADAVLCRLVAP